LKSYSNYCLVYFNQFTSPKLIADSVLWMHIAGAALLVYNSISNCTRTLAPMPKTVQQYGMALVHDGDVLVCGGFSSQGVADCSLYNAFYSVWGKFPSLPVSMYGFSMVTLHGRPYVFGGYRSGGTGWTLNL
jgi:hypothetical protein